MKKPRYSHLINFLISNTSNFWNNNTIYTNIYNVLPKKFYNILTILLAYERDLNF